MTDKMYPMDLVGEDVKLIADVVNQGIDSHLQAVTDSKFEVYTDELMGNTRMKCEIAPNDMRVILRRLLELDDDIIEDAESLVIAIVTTLGIEDFWLMTDARFYITLYEDDEDDWEYLACLLDLPYISIFDEDFWPRLFDEVL